MSIFSANLTFLRKERKLTQFEVSQALCVKVKRYEAWEEGRAEPPYYLLVKIADFFEVSDIYQLLTFRLITPPFVLPP